MTANGHTMSTIHHGGRLSCAAPSSMNPQYHSAATQTCCEPWTMHARNIQTSVAAPASSPKLRPKKQNAAADAIAYAQVEALERATCATLRTLATDGKPIRKKAMPKNTHGAEST